MPTRAGGAGRGEFPSKGSRHLWLHECLPSIRSVFIFLVGTKKSASTCLKSARLWQLYTFLPVRKSKMTGHFHLVSPSVQNKLKYFLRRENYIQVSSPSLLPVFCWLKWGKVGQELNRVRFQVTPGIWGSPALLHVAAMLIVWPVFGKIPVSYLVSAH